jgi:stearoyl-CoA desaturase (delta-9 desaturase)
MLPVSEISMHPVRNDVRSPTPAMPGDGARTPRAEGWWQSQSLIPATIYWSLHMACLLAFWTGVTPFEVTLCLGLFWVRLFGITGGYHRYFSHKTFKTSRAFQFVLAVIGVAAVQKGPLWWAAGHRRHHRYSDQEGDMHSPREGFWHAHQGWIFDGRWDATEVDRIRDFSKFPELAFLNRWHIVVPLGLVAACFALGGLGGFVWGFCISTVLLWHSTYTINSLAHRWGSQRYETGDDSRNNLFLALLTLGEGWHNNHHHYMASARQGFFWWEIDVTYYVLRGLEVIGLVWDLREPPADVIRPKSKVATASKVAA